MFSIWIATLHSFQWFVLLLHEVVRPFGINRISTMSVKYSWLHRACCAMTKWVLWKACDQTATIRKIGELANFPWGIPQKGLGKVMIFLRLSGGIQYLSYTSSPLIFDLNIQQVEKKCVPAACGTSDDFIAQHETPYIWSTWRVAIYRSRTTLNMIMLSTSN